MMGLLDLLDDKGQGNAGDEVPDDVAVVNAAPEKLPEAVSPDSVLPAMDDRGQGDAAGVEPTPVPVAEIKAPALPAGFPRISGHAYLGKNSAGEEIHADAAGRRVRRNSAGVEVGYQVFSHKNDTMSEFANEAYLTTLEQEARRAVLKAKAEPPQSVPAASPQDGNVVTHPSFKRGDKLPGSNRPALAISGGVGMGLILGPGSPVEKPAEAPAQAPAAKSEGAASASKAAETGDAPRRPEYRRLADLLGTPLKSVPSQYGETLEYQWGSVIEQKTMVSVLKVKEMGRTVRAMLDIVENRGWDPVLVTGTDKRLREEFIACAFEKGLRLDLVEPDDRVFLEELQKKAADKDGSAPAAQEKG